MGLDARRTVQRMILDEAMDELDEPFAGI